MVYSSEKRVSHIKIRDFVDIPSHLPFLTSNMEKSGQVTVSSIITYDTFVSDSRNVPS